MVNVLFAELIGILVGDDRRLCPNISALEASGRLFFFWVIFDVDEEFFWCTRRSVENFGAIGIVGVGLSRCALGRWFSFSSRGRCFCFLFIFVCRRSSLALSFALSFANRSCSNRSRVAFTFFAFAAKLRLAASRDERDEAPAFVFVPTIFFFCKSIRARTRSLALRCSSSGLLFLLFASCRF